MTTKRSNRKAGGFRVPARTATLVFEDKLYQGAEIVVNLSVPLGVSMSLREQAESDDPATIYATFVEHGLESWNLEGADGKPLPMTVTGLETLPTDFVLFVLDQWTIQIGKVPVPLWARSSDGNTSPEESDPTADL